MENLRNLRLKKGYSQSQLGDFLNVGAGVVARWETAQTVPSLTQILKICHILRCKPTDLYITENISAENNNCKSIPVFDEGKVYIHTVPADSHDVSIDFGIILSSDTDARLCKGDVCFFTMQNHTEDNSIVLVSDDDYNSRIILYRKDDNHKIIAVCTSMHRQL